MGELTMGRRSYGDPIRRGTANTVTIGNYCSIAEGVVMDGGFSHRTDFVSTFPFHTLTSYAHNNINLGFFTESTEPETVSSNVSLKWTFLWSKFFFCKYANIKNAKYTSNNATNTNNTFWVIVRFRIVSIMI